MTLATLRDSIPATHHGIYMNTGFSGPSPAPVVEAIREHLDNESRLGPASVAGLKLAREVNEAAQVAVAALLKAEPDEISITHGTTEGCHVVLYGLPWRSGDELVTCSLEHPALATAAAVLEERFGVTIKRVEVPPTASEAEMIDLVTSAIGPRTRVVALSHIQYTCALKMPMRPIADAAHAVGALFLVDGAQTGGQIRLDVRALGVDFYAVSGQKWLLGPHGTGAMFVASEHARTIEPVFSTHSLADGRVQRAETALPTPLARFRMTAQSPALVAGLVKAVGLVQEIGLETIEGHANRLAQRMRQGIETIDGCSLTCSNDPATHCGLVPVAIEGWEPLQVVDELLSRSAITARSVTHPPAVRFSTAAFNTEAEVDRVLEQLGAIAKERPAIEVPAAGQP